MVGNIVDVGWATIKSGCLPITAWDPQYIYLGAVKASWRYYQGRIAINPTTCQQLKLASNTRDPQCMYIPGSSKSELGVPGPP